MDQKRTAHLDTPALGRAWDPREAGRSLALLTFALEVVHEAVFLIDEEARFRYVNQESLRILGYTRDEALDLGVADVDPDFPETRWPEHWAELKAKRTLTFEGRHRAKGGRIFPVEINANYFEFDGEGFNLALVRDITERRKAEALLSRRERELNESQRLADIGSWDWDSTTDVIWWSDHYYTLYGADPGRPTPPYLEHLKAYTSESADRLDAAVNHAMATGAPYEVDLELANPTRSARWVTARGEVKVDEQGRIVGLRGTSQNITARKRTEEALRSLNRSLRAISSCNLTLLRAREEPALLEEICRIICEEAGYRVAWVGFAEQDAARTIRPVAWAGSTREFLDRVTFTWADTEAGRGPAGTAIRTGHPDAIPDVLTDPRAEHWRAGALADGFRSLLALPLKNGEGQPFGVLMVHSAEAGAFPAEEMRLLEELSGDLAFGITALRTGLERRKAEEALAQSEARFRQTLDDMLEGCMILGTDWTYRYVNEAAARHGRSTREQLLGRTLQESHPGLERTEIFDRYRRCMETREPQQFEASYTFPGEGPAWFTFSVEPASEGIFVLTIETTDRMRGEHALARAHRALRTLSAGNEALVRATREEDLLQSVTRVIVEQGGYAMARVSYAEDDPEKTLRRVAWAGQGEDFYPLQRLTWAEGAPNQPPIARTIRSGIPEVCHDIARESGFAEWREAALARGYTANIALPLSDGARTFGGLSIYATEKDAFDAEECRLLTELATDLAFGIVTLRTRRERDRIALAHQRQTEALQQSMEQSIQAIAATVEARDPYTSGHQRRVSQLAVALAREMGLPEDRIHGIHLGAVIHDLGKIHVPAEILTKPGRLTGIEFRMIQLHPQAGYDILAGVDFPWPIAKIVLQHHERLDGSGYPQGLRGDDILLEARIMAVADVVEAMVSHRPYRPALELDAALQAIGEGRGATYDPAVVDACLALFREGRFAFQA